MKTLTQKSKIQFLFIGLFFLFACAPLSPVCASEIRSSTVIQLVNTERIKEGLEILKNNELLSEAAENKLKDMIRQDYFAHTSPKGITPWHWVEKSGYDYKYAGENLAINFSSAESQHKAWMKSPTHKKNILNPNYEEIGVAVAEGKIDGQKAILTVQLFGTQRVAVGSKTEKETLIPEKVAVSENVAGQEKTVVPAEIPENISQSKWLPAETSKLDVVRPICESGNCYFRETNIAEHQETSLPQRTAWVIVVLVMVVSISINLMTLTQEHGHNPFIAANTFMLMLVLTTMVIMNV